MWAEAEFHGGGAGPHLVGRNDHISYFISRLKGITWRSLNVFQWLMGRVPVAPDTFISVGKVERANFCLSGFSVLFWVQRDERRIEDNWTCWSCRSTTAGGL